MGKCFATQLLSLLLIFGLVVPSLATTYTVDWSVNNAAGLLLFPIGKTFYVGDILEFKYTPFVNAVFEVPLIGYEDCDPSQGFSHGLTGDTLVTLTTTGPIYFISYFQDCLQEQKLAIEVSGGP